MPLNRPDNNPAIPRPTIKGMQLFNGFAITIKVTLTKTSELVSKIDFFLKILIFLLKSYHHFIVASFTFRNNRMRILIISHQIFQKMEIQHLLKSITTLVLSLLGHCGKLHL